MSIKAILARSALDLAHRASRCARWPLEALRPIVLPERGIAAHRGASATHPENTLAAFREAVELGVQQIELDVRLTRDRKLVVIHDKMLDRTTTGRGMVKDQRLAQINQLDAGTWKHSRFTGERVPTLARALRGIPRNVWINLHVKGGPSAAKRAARSVYIRGRTDQVFLAVRAAGARAARSEVPGIKICCMDRGECVEDHIERAIASKADFIQLLRDDGMPSAEILDRAHRAGLKVNFCTAVSEEEVSRLFALGVDFPMLDDPGLASTQA